MYPILNEMNADVIVIGLGAMGSAACYQLSRRGASVIGIDRYSPPHMHGSSHGETRITRKAIGEGEHLVPFALRSYEIWRELEAETGEDLLTITGGLIMSAKGGRSLHGNADFLNTTIEAARKFGITHRVLNADDIADEFPRFELTGTETGYFENDAGFLRPERCVAAQLELAEEHGAVLRRNERVLKIDRSGPGVEISTDTGRYSAHTAIVSAGPWVDEFVPTPAAGRFRVFRQALYWFDISSAYQDYAVGNFPVFIWSFGRWDADFVYGFPAVGGPAGGLKVATENFERTTRPDEADREVSPRESAEMFATYVEGKLRGVSKSCVRSAACLYTMTDDSNFVIGRISENVILASPCSGHGFKHSAAIGETLAELALTGRSTIDVSRFSMSR